jgi:hypothetical protein
LGALGQWDVHVQIGGAAKKNGIDRAQHFLGVFEEVVVRDEKFELLVRAFEEAIEGCDIRNE